MRRLRQRLLFGEATGLYDASRPGYTAHVDDGLVKSVGLDDKSRVLEIGCGSGQLTCALAAHGLRVTAIDISASMVSAARRKTSGATVDFRTGSFERFTEKDGSFDLVVAADALHWIDPELRFSKVARLLREGGWLAILSIAHDYAEPFGSAFREMWIA